MDPNTGRIHRKPEGITDEAWAEYCARLGLVSVDAKDLPALRKMNRHQRRAVLSKMRRGVV